MTPEQIMKYQQMDKDFENYKADSIKLHKFYKALVKFIPTTYMLKHLQKSKIIKRKWELNNNGK